MSVLRVPGGRMGQYLTEAQFWDWLTVLANPGDCIVYHRGLLAYDRCTPGRFERDGDDVRCDRVAALALQQAALGRVYLVQRRHGFCDYSYLAILTKRGRGDNRS